MLQYFSFSIIYQSIFFTIGGSPFGFLFFVPLYLIVKLKLLITNLLQLPHLRIKNPFNFYLCIKFIMLFLISLLIFKLDYEISERINAFIIFFFVGLLFRDGIKLHKVFYISLLIIFLYILYFNFFYSFFHTGALSFSIWRENENVLNYQSLSVALIGIYLLSVQSTRNLFILFLLIPILFVGGSRSVFIAYTLTLILYTFINIDNVKKKLLLLVSIISITIFFYFVIYSVDSNSSLRFSDTYSLSERSGLTIFHIQNSISLLGYFAHDIVKYGEEGAYAHNFLDFLFAYGILGFIISTLILLRYFIFLFNLLKTDSFIVFFDFFILIYLVLFGNNLSIEFSYLFGKFLSNTIYFKSNNFINSSSNQLIKGAYSV